MSGKWRMDRPFVADFPIVVRNGKTFSNFDRAKEVLNLSRNACAVCVHFDVKNTKCALSQECNWLGARTKFEFAGWLPASKVVEVLDQTKEASNVDR